MAIDRAEAETPESSEQKIETPRLLLGEDLVNPEQSRFLNGHVAIYTHASPEKTGGNEDTLALIPTGPDTGVLIVVDGVGGLPTGSEAARMTIDCLAETVARVDENYGLRDAILDGIERANQNVLAGKTGSAATFAAIEVNGTSVRPYHVGDALILITGQRGKIKQQNIPHSPVGYAVESGLLDVDAAVHHEERNLVSNVIGDPDMRIEIGPVTRLSPRDTLVLASDGLSDNLYLEEIVEAVRIGPMEHAAATLVSSCAERMGGGDARLPGHPDDLSFIVFRLDAKHRGRQITMEF